MPLKPVRNGVDIGRRGVAWLWYNAHMNLSHQNGLPERPGHMASGGEIIVYQPDSMLRLEVKVDGSMAWLNRQ